METTKPWYKSKTMWLNIAAGGLALADQAAGAGIGGPYFVPVLAALNLFLRTVTSQPLKG